MLFVLVLGVVVSIIFAIKAERARSRAQAVSDYLLENVLDSRRDGALLERDFGNTLDNAVKGLEGKFKDKPLIEASIRNTQTVSENLSNANSRVRDVDVAAETSRLASRQILQQAGISVLGQANAMPQLALSLLGG